MTLQRLPRILLFTLLVLGSLAVYLLRGQFDIDAVERWVAEHSITAPFLFIGLYVLLTILFFPSTLLSLAGGVLFGPLWGALYTQASAMLSATLSFITARYLAADWVENRLAGDLQRLKHGVEVKGWRFVLLLRIVPGLPFAMLNYALGLTRIRLLHFVSVTFACILPRVILYAYAGDAGRRAMAGKDIGIELPIILGLFAFALALPYLLRRYKRHITV